MSELPEIFKKPYNAQDHEKNIYSMWEDSGYFNPDVCIEKGIAELDAPVFSMVLPPPNVTGILHTGHALMTTVEDTLARYHRMKGYRTLWLPGTDHAAIATESKVAKMLEKKKIRKREIGREGFLKHVDTFVEENKGNIQDQVRKIGASLDWSREAFTLDEQREQAVFEAFKRMYDAGLIYRGHRIVNWDPKGQTTISDDEIVRVEEKTKFYYFKYGPFTIGTARPETKFADKYVVIHPEDERYKEYKHGQTLEIEWINGPITATILKDEASDPEFGSGVMTITPWHSAIDFELAEKHNLPKEQIIDKYGKLLAVAGEFAGMKIKEAREKIVEKLDSKGLLINVEEDYVHQLATAERTGATIEPQIMEQWFVDVNKEFEMPHSEIEGIETSKKTTLKKLMLHVVGNDQVNILPDRFEKIYFNWINNLRDWCISRQLWFGHRIPVWYKNKNKEEGIKNNENTEMRVSLKSPGEDWEQDSDVLDTWFSSGLWTFSTLGWPDKTEDLRTYHPTTVLETGYDIIFFWVARMILMTTFLTGQIPFKTVYIHGLVRDKQGRKLSKSLGNNIDPRELSKKYGTDALRMSLTVAVGPGADNNFSDEKINTYRKFANKVWNASRFVLENTLGRELGTPEDLPEKHKAYLEELDTLTAELTKEMDRYKLHLVSEKLYHYFWHTFADVIIEELKDDLKSKDEETAQPARYVLATILETSLKLLHPFMPFITEVIWQEMYNGERMLMVEKWPGFGTNDK